MQHEDLEVREIIRKEYDRRKYGLEMIPSENFTSRDVLNALGSVLTDKYSEGYPEKRYYGGNQFIDEVESLAIRRAKVLFGVPYANVQPYSGSPANLAVYLALLSPGDVVMGQNLSDGGHLTHGSSVSITGSHFKSVQYHVKPDGRIDIDEAWRLAREHRPRLIWVGSTAYVYQFPFREMGEIADSVGAYLAADISHIAGLVVGGVHPSPIMSAHIVTTTTHKTLRGPRGAIIMATEKGRDKDPAIFEKIDKAVFPGLQGGPHENNIAGIAIALGEATRSDFKNYATQVVSNAKTVAKTLKLLGIDVVSGTTENHMILINLSKYGPGKGVFVQEMLDAANITANKNTVPGEQSSPFYPSGVRLGTPALTTRGMKEPQMEQISIWVADLTKAAVEYNLPADKAERAAYLKMFKESVRTNQMVTSIRRKVHDLCALFPMPY